METLQSVVRTVYKALKKTEKYMSIEYDYIEEILPKEIFFYNDPGAGGSIPELHTQGEGVQHRQTQRRRVHHADRRNPGIRRKTRRTRPGLR